MRRRPPSARSCCSAAVGRRHASRRTRRRRGRDRIQRPRHAGRCSTYHRANPVGAGGQRWGQRRRGSSSRPGAWGSGVRLAASGGGDRGDCAEGGAVIRGDCAEGGGVIRGDCAEGGGVIRGDCAEGGGVIRGDWDEARPRPGWRQTGGPGLARRGSRAATSGDETGDGAALLGGLTGTATGGAGGDGAARVSATRLRDPLTGNQQTGFAAHHAWAQHIKQQDRAKSTASDTGARPLRSAARRITGSTRPPPAWPFSTSNAAGVARVAVSSVAAASRSLAGPLPRTGGAWQVDERKASDRHRAPRHRLPAASDVEGAAPRSTG